MNGIHMDNPGRTRAAMFAAAMLMLVSLAPFAVAGDDDTIKLHLFWTNDMHGHIAPEKATFMNPAFPPPLGGGASLMAYFKQAREEAEAAGEATLLVDAGDMFSGAPVGTKTQGTAVIDFYNAAGYELLVPGNHDFDQGRENAERLAKMSNFPWVCCNLIEESTGELVDWVVPTLMLDKGGVKVGVIGMITPSTPAASFAENVAGLLFVDPDEPIARYRDELKEAGADIILLVAHEGLPYDRKEGWEKIAGNVEEIEDGDRGASEYGVSAGHGDWKNLMEIVNTVPGIDVAVGGHSHVGYNEPWIDPKHHTICLEAYARGSSIGHVILKIDAGTKRLIGFDKPHDRGTLITLYEDELWPDEEITEVIRPWREQTEEALNEVVGSTRINLKKGTPAANTVGVLVTEAMLEYFDADFAIQNMGGLRAEIPQGDITARQVFDVLPFGNILVIVHMKGAMLRRAVERKLAGGSSGMCVAGCEMTYDSTRPDYDRVVHFKIRGEDFDVDRTYRVVMTNFLAEGNSGFGFLSSLPPEAIELSEITTAGAVELYLSRHSPVQPRAGLRWLEEKGREQASYLQTPYLEEGER